MSKSKSGSTKHYDPHRSEDCCSKHIYKNSFHDCEASIDKRKKTQLINMLRKNKCLSDLIFKENGCNHNQCTSCYQEIKFKPENTCGSYHDTSKSWEKFFPDSSTKNHDHTSKTRNCHCPTAHDSSKSWEQFFPDGSTNQDNHSINEHCCEASIDKTKKEQLIKVVRGQSDSKLQEIFSASKSSEINSQKTQNKNTESSISNESSNPEKKIDEKRRQELINTIRERFDKNNASTTSTNAS